MLSSECFFFDVTLWKQCESLDVYACLRRTLWLVLKLLESSGFYDIM